MKIYLSLLRGLRRALVVVTLCAGGVLAKDGNWYSTVFSGYLQQTGGPIFEFSLDGQGNPILLKTIPGSILTTELDTWDMDHWKIELPNFSGYLSRGINVDGLSRVHVMTNSYYYVKSTAGWQSQPLPFDPLLFSVGHSGVPYALYTQAVGGVVDVYFAVLRESGWQSTLVSSGNYLVYIGLFKMAVANDGSGYVGLVDSSGLSVYRVLNGTSEKLFSDTYSLYSVLSLDVDYSNKLHILYNGRYSAYPPYAPQDVVESPHVIKVASNGSPTFFKVKGDQASIRGGGVYEELFGTAVSSESVPFPISSNRIIGFHLGIEDRPYILFSGPSLTDPDLRNDYYQLAAKLPPPPSLVPASRTTSSIEWAWPAATSAIVTGYHVRRSTDDADLSGLLPATATGWTQGGLSGNAPVSTYLQTVYPGFLLPSSVAAAHSLAFPPKSIGISRSAAGDVSVLWSANGNPAGTDYRVEFHASDGHVLVSTVASPSFIYPFLNPLVPFGVNIVALSGDGEESPLARVESVVVDGGKTSWVFALGDLHVEANVFPSAGYGSPAMMAAPVSEFPASPNETLNATFRGFQLEMDRELPDGQSATVSVIYPEGWLDTESAGPYLLARYDIRFNQWLPLPTQHHGRRLTATVDGFGVFQVMGRIASTSALEEFKVYPNPFRPAGGGTVVLNPVPEGGRVRVLTLSGRTVRTLEGTETGLVEWDGRDTEGDVVKSGVYLLSLERKGETKKLKIIVEQ